MYSKDQPPSLHQTHTSHTSSPSSHYLILFPGNYISQLLYSVSSGVLARLTGWTSRQGSPGKSVVGTKASTCFNSLVNSLVRDTSGEIWQSDISINDTVQCSWMTIKHQLSTSYSVTIYLCTNTVYLQICAPNQPMYALHLLIYTLYLSIIMGCS